MQVLLFRACASGCNRAECAVHADERDKRTRKESSSMNSDECYNEYVDRYGEPLDPDDLRDFCDSLTENDTELCPINYAIEALDSYHEETQ